MTKTLNINAMENAVFSDPILIRIVRWTARTISLLAIFIVLFFAIAEAMTDDQGTGESTPFLNILMGVLMLGGLGIAWRWELTGAMISIVGFIGVIILNPDAGLKPGMILFAFPAILYLICGIWHKLSPRKLNTSSKLAKD